VDKITANGGRLNTGFLGTPYLLAALTDTGHSDVAYHLLLNTEYPSWGYLVEHGATTMWERWNGDQMRADPSMNSYNHYAYGAVAEWIYRYAAGIDTSASDPGFHTIFLHPTFDSRLATLDFAYQSPYGKVHSSWSANATKALWTVTIPPNATGQLSFAAGKAGSYSIDGQMLNSNPKVKVVASESGTELYEIPAGTYSFEVAISK
jgi:alpha-L-rhamnosidase